MLSVEKVHDALPRPGFYRRLIRCEYLRRQCQSSLAACRNTKQLTWIPMLGSSFKIHLLDSKIVSRYSGPSFCKYRTVGGYRSNRSSSSSASLVISMP